MSHDFADLLVDGHRILPSLLRDLRAAQHSIHFSVFLFFRDPELEVVLVVPAGKHNDNSFAQDAQEYHYKSYIECGIEVYEYQNHFNHLKMAVFDERISLHGSTNLNYRSLEDDKDFELVVFVDDASFAAEVLREVRDVDIQCSKRITRADVAGISLDALRKRVRDPRTLLLLSRRML